MTEEVYQRLHSADEDSRLHAILDLEAPLSKEDITEVVNMLADPNWRVRKAAVQVSSQADSNTVIPLLLQSLSSSGDKDLHDVCFQNAAIECLTIIGRPAIPALTTALQHPNKDVRISAANALGSIQHHDACDALIHALQDDHINVRYSAIEALAKIPSQTSVIPLTQILESENEWLKLPAISALGNIGDYRATPYLIKVAQQPLYLQTVVEALGNIGDERGIPCIIEALESQDQEVRRSAVFAMDNMARRLDHLHDIIQQPSTYRQRFKTACSTPIIHYLTRFLDDPNPRLVMATIKLLGWSGRREAAEVLLKHLNQDQFQEAVVSALIQIGEDAIPTLAAAYEASSNLDDQMLMLDCLQEIGSPQTLHLFLDYLNRSTDESLIYTILKGLAQPVLTQLLLADRETQTGQQFEQALTVVHQHLNSAHPLIRAEATDLLGHLQGMRALDEILSATKDAEPAIRVKAIKHLGHFAQQDQDLTQHLIVLLSDDHPTIRKQAALSLGHSDHASVFSALLLVLEDQNPAVRRAAVSGIGLYLQRHQNITNFQQVLDKLAEVLDTRCRRYEDGLLKIEICSTLRHIPSDRSQELLLQLMQDYDFDVRKSVLLALGTFTEAVASLTPLILPFLHDEHWSVREAAATALGVLRASDAEAALLEKIDDPDRMVQRAALLALGQIDSVRAIPILVAKLGEENLDQAAYQALTLLARDHHELLHPYLEHENPKIHVFIEHILDEQG